MILNAIWSFILKLLQSLVERFPPMNTANWSASLAPMARLISWLQKLNAYVPVFELLVAIGVLLGIMATLYTVMTIRRTFSLFWPGAGG